MIASGGVAKRGLIFVVPAGQQQVKAVRRIVKRTTRGYVFTENVLIGMSIVYPPCNFLEPDPSRAGFLNLRFLYFFAQRLSPFAKRSGDRTDDRHRQAPLAARNDRTEAVGRHSLRSRPDLNLLVFV